MQLPRRSAASSSGASAVTRFVSSIVGRFRGEPTCAGWTLANYYVKLDQYLLTCGDQHRVVPGEVFNDWVERDDGTWAEPHG